MRVQAWAPGHTTLLFAVPENYSEPQKMGSIGAGFNFETGVLTTIEESRSDTVKWNSQIIEGEVSLTALKRFRDLFNISTKFEINHYSELKIGHGLSTSGAGALGVVLTLNEFTNSGVSETELYEIAHYADVVNHTGLGSVMGQISGGIEIRTSQGGPGYGNTETIPVDDEMIILMIDKLKTSDVLVSEKQMNQVTVAGQEAISKIHDFNSNYVDRILAIGRDFTNNCGLATPRIKDMLNKLELIGEENASMAMIGETIIIHPNNSDNIVEFARKHRIDCVVTKFCNSKPMILESTT